MLDLIKAKEKYTKLPKQIFRKREKEIKKKWDEKQEDWALFHGSKYKISNRLLINILGFLIAMNDTFEDIRKKCKDYDQSLIKLIYSRRTMSKRIKLNFFDPQEDAEEIFKNTKEIINKHNNGWDSLNYEEKFYEICRYVLYYDLQEEGFDFESSADLSGFTLEILFPIFLSEINNISFH